MDTMHFYKANNVYFLRTIFFAFLGSHLTIWHALENTLGSEVDQMSNDQTLPPGVSFMWFSLIFLNIFVFFFMNMQMR